VNCRFDPIARRDEFAGDAIAFVETKRSLLADESVEATLEIFQGAVQEADHALLRRGKRGLDVIEALQRQFLPVGEMAHFSVSGVRNELQGGDAHRQQAGLEVAAAVGDFGMRCTLLKARPTSASPVMKASPTARKPRTGMMPSAIMRARTDNPEKICLIDIEQPE